MTLSIDIQHNSIECHYAECLYANCRDYLNVMLNVIMLNVVMLSVVAPKLTPWRHRSRGRERCHGRCPSWRRWPGKLYPSSLEPSLNASTQLLPSTLCSSHWDIRGRFVEQMLMLSCCFRWPNSLQKLLWIWLHFVVLLKSDLDVQQTHLRYWLLVS